MEQFVCLSGLPRSGSTLLSAILSQNPLIHAEGNSAVCQLMWDLQQSCLTSAKEQLKANGRDQHTTRALLTSVPKLYYQTLAETGEKIVVDKCRSWTIPANLSLLEKYVDPNYKVIILERSVADIVKSFQKLYQANGIKCDNIESLLKPNSEPIMRSLAGINCAKKNNQANHFLFVNYTELVDNPAAVLKQIYEFCGWAPFTHHFQDIVSKYPEDDTVYGMQGMHKVHGKVIQRDNPIRLKQSVSDSCAKIDKLMGYC
jgi:sulfotransferase